MFSPGAILALVLRNFLVVWELSSLAILTGFRFESIFNRNTNPGNLYFQHDRIIRVSESPDIEKPKLDRYRFDVFTTKTRRRTTTCLKMLENTNDPDILLKMVEDLAMEEITPKIMAKMEVVEIALAKFLEEKSAEFREESLLKPSPLPTPPPGTLIDNESDAKFKRRGQQERDLAEVGIALEKLRQRLREKGVVVPETEETFQQSLEDEEILRRAEQALRKSREAAKLRKVEAERRSVSAAKVSAGYRQQQQKKKIRLKEHEQEKKDENSGMKSFQTIEEYQNSKKKKSNEFYIPKKRPTVELENLFGKRVEGENATTRDSSDDGSNEFMEERDNRAPEGLPMLYNWVQDEDGCIMGKIKGSIIFEDGATISTSSVAQGARGGTVVTTGSGSRYFLEELVGMKVANEEKYKKDATLKLISTTSENNKVPKAPDGVPIVKGWEFREGGGIIGLIYDSPDADDGDCIETSPIVDGEVEDYSVVSTRSGSRYFLSGDPPEIALDILLTSRDDLTTERRPLGGTVTLTKEGREAEDEDEEEGTSRSTFSLLALFDGKRNTESSYSRDSAPQPLPPPSPDKVPPIGTPTLTGCVFNDDRTISGYIFGSPKIDDGYLITTSPVVDGEGRQFETVTTATGSVYFLG